MATITLTELLVRVRTIATQMGLDANQSQLIDSLAGMRALLNHCVLEIYRRKAREGTQFLRDITAKTTVTISNGSGTLPDDVLREFLGSGNFADDTGSLIVYLDYAADYNSRVNFTQLGYCFLLGDTIQYTAPAPLFDSYNGNLFITSPVLPTVGATMTFPTEDTINDIILLLARAVRGEEKFLVVDMVAA